MVERNGGRQALAAPHLAVAAEQVAERDERPDAAGRAAAGADPHARSRVAAAALLAGDDLALARRRLVAGGVDQRQAGDLAACRDVAHLHFHRLARSEEHTSELQSLMRTSYAVFCLKTQIRTT